MKNEQSTADPRESGAESMKDFFEKAVDAHYRDPKSTCLLLTQKLCAKGESLESQLTTTQRELVEARGRVKELEGALNQIREVAHETPEDQSLNWIEKTAAQAIALTPAPPAKEGE